MPVDEFGREILFAGGSSGALLAAAAAAAKGGGGSPLLDSSLSASREVSYRGGDISASHYHHNKSSNSSSPPLPKPLPRSIRGNKNHPAFQYVEDPLLCQFLWKEQRPQKTDQNINNDSTTEGEEEEYAKYRQSYCLNYVRAFFNRHLDDSWFRNKYSPSARWQYRQQERTMAITEAKALASLPSDDVVSWARLGEGVKSTNNNVTASAATTTTTIQSPRITNKKNQAAALVAANNNETPKAHLFSFQQNNNGDVAYSLLHITEIPPHVTHQQLLLALSLQSTKVKTSDLILLPSSVGFATRDAVVLGPGDLWTTLVQKINGGGDHISTSMRGIRDDVPRKGEAEPLSSMTTAATAVVVRLDVECSDPYGRLEYDVDGRGGAPVDGLPVPVRKSVVSVSLLPPHHHHHNGGTATTQQRSKNKCVTVTLSAALSSSSRFESDKQAALTLAQALDRKKDIPVGCRLQDIVRDEWAVSDALDVAIAYLRRVHLFSFYHGCVKAEYMADVLTGKSAVSTIHLRLQNADEILKDDHVSGNDANKNETANGVGAKDLLVQRLDDSIATALSEIDNDTSGLVDLETERDATAIHEAEEQVKKRWLDDHCVTDADGRARCSFAFCHKLFKDSTFLYKHLLKKHVEFLRAEQAKCHDEYMMKAWDRAVSRPVPHILVDCGVRFGTVATPVTGGLLPDCVDPEPELWRREEERRQRDVDMRARRDEVRQQHENRPQPPPRSAAVNFVDVDDMKEEKIELSFDNVEVPDPSAAMKKKKKKRKLL